MFRRAQVAAAADNWALAYRTLKIAREHDPHDARMMALEGWVIFNMPYDNQERQYRICKEHLQSALTIQPDLPEAFYYLGRMAESRYDFEDAAQAYQRALAHNPDYLEARKMLERLERRGVIIQPDTGKEDSKGVLNRLMSWLDS